MINRLFSTSSCVDTFGATVGVTKLLKIRHAQRRSSHSPNRVRGTARCGCELRCSDPNSAAIVFQGFSFAWLQPSYRSGFHHSACCVHKCCVRSNQRPQIRSLLKPRIQRARTTDGWPQWPPPHWLTELCQGGNGAPSLTPFVCCLTVSAKLRPTVHAGGLRHKPSQQVVVCWHHTPSLIDLTCPYDDVHCTLCSTVGLWVTISGRLLHNIACPSQLHRPQ